MTSPSPKQVHPMPINGGFCTIFRIEVAEWPCLSPFCNDSEFWRDTKVPGITRYPASRVHPARLDRKLQDQWIVSSSRSIWIYSVSTVRLVSLRDTRGRSSGKAVVGLGLSGDGIVKIETVTIEMREFPRGSILGVPPVKNF